MEGNSSKKSLKINRGWAATTKENAKRQMSMTGKTVICITNTQLSFGAASMFMEGSSEF